MKKYKAPSSGTTLLRASSLCLMLAGPSVALAGSNSAEITASVSVVSTDICSVQVSLPDNIMQMTWTRDAHGVGHAELTSTTLPAYVTVRAQGGTSCNLNNMKLRTLAGPGMIPLTTEGDITVFRANAGSQGAFWRILPLLADARFYTDEAMAMLGSGKISWDGPKAGDVDEVTFSPQIVKPGKEVIPTASVGQGDFMFMTDEYVEAGGALLVDSAGNTGSFSSDAPSEQYKSAKLGFGALIATEPENVDGVPSPQLGSGGDTFTFSWTVYIDQA
ncbi:hypothetical protein [Serratia fonticola]|uniref:hypothetical protein n=1 Tax=Serratia fonticola TaxID=47917 RepID=UPI002DBE6505|nr:hypothetical protein [Serratia fonticola]MEB7884011.1 hypothetical protein [Serratia fonticola]